ncbi:TPA: N-glycosylase/DNA lyase [Candidatus Bathyarchaeota archaeon]|nr:N-glycosylase/DNA lyase [Candidatus Bathyarchaeota archaeon]
MSSLVLTVKMLHEVYKRRRNEIQKRIFEFKNLLKRPEEDIFVELCFCLCTPQSRATTCWNVISKMVKEGILFYGSADDIALCLKGVRFRRNKAAYIIEARRLFAEKGQIKIKSILLEFKNPLVARNWLVKRVKGLGMKEASHFLRNVGLGLDLAILDRHVLRSLKELNVIRNVPRTLTKKVYEDIEEKMRIFSRKVEIPMADLDLLIWSIKTGFVFK